jgi:hypothetical protein
VDALPFREIWLVDFEFAAAEGERPVVRCMVALELRTGKLVRIWDLPREMQGLLQKSLAIPGKKGFVVAQMGGAG